MPTTAFPLPLTLTTFALALAGPATGVAAEPVKFDFSWPAGLRAQVTVESERTRGSGAERKTTSATTHYEIVTRPVDDSVVVTPGQVRMDVGAAVSPAERAPLEMATLAGLPPYVVSAKGEFLRIQDVAKVRDEIRQLVLKMLPPSPDAEARARAEKVLDQVTSEAVLTAQQEGEWNLIVGYWLGASLDIGAPYATSYHMAIPIVPGATARWDSRFQLLRLVPCERQGQARTCAELELVNTPDRADVTQAIGRFVSNAMPNAQGQLEDMELEQHLRLSTEVPGLIPHHYEYTKTVRVKSTDKGEKKVAEQVQVQRVDFDYR